MARKKGKQTVSTNGDRGTHEIDNQTKGLDQVDEGVEYLYIHEPHCYLFSVLYDDDDDAMMHATETVNLSVNLCYLFPSFSSFLPTRRNFNWNSFSLFFA